MEVVEPRSYPEVMGTQVGEVNERGEVIVELVAGIPVSAEGKARARRKLDEARRLRTPEVLNAMRAKIGMPPATA